MLDNGWIKLHRKITSNPVWTKPEYAHVWLHILLQANTEDKKLIVNNSVYNVPRGSFLTSIRNICKATGINSTSNIRRILNFLKTAQMVTHIPTHDFTHIYVTNYDLYQEDRLTKRLVTRTPRERQENESKKDKKDKKKETKKVTRVYTREIKETDYKEIADYFVIDEDFVKKTHRKILDYELSKFGDEHYKDMKATIRGWIQRSIDRGEIKQGEIVARWN